MPNYERIFDQDSRHTGSGRSTGKRQFEGFSPMGLAVGFVRDRNAGCRLSGESQSGRFSTVENRWGVVDAGAIQKSLTCIILIKSKVLGRVSVRFGWRTPGLLCGCGTWNTQRAGWETRQKM